MGFSRQEYWSGLPFASPVDRILSELSTMTRPSWVALNCMPHSFIELDKAVIHVIRLASCLWIWFQSVYPLMPSLSAYHLTWISLSLDVGYLFTATPAKSSRCSLPWMWGSSSHNWLKYYTSCRCSTVSFNIFIHYKMTTIGLTTISHHA